MTLAFLDARLTALRTEGLYRDPEQESVRRRLVSAHPALLDVSSNDYLGLARRDVPRETLTLPRAGSGASRLIHGTHPPHRDLEQTLAEWTGHADALLFSSGYAANVGLLSSLPQAGDSVFSDALNHASIIDGCRLSRATTFVYPHLSLEALGAALAQAPSDGERWVVSETLFSMDGDRPDLSRLRDLCDVHGAHLILDEAHALGILGPAGAGLAASAGIAPDALVGTFGKAIGTAGAFVAGSKTLRTWLWNRARSFIYSTAPPPSMTAVTLHHVRQARDAAHLRDHLFQLCRRFSSAAATRGLPIPPHSPGPIFPVVLGDLHRLETAATHLRAAGILAHGIRPPTVPPGTARLRITLTASLSFADIDRLADALHTACHE